MAEKTEYLAKIFAENKIHCIFATAMIGM